MQTYINPYDLGFCRLVCNLQMMVVLSVEEQIVVSRCIYGSYIVLWGRYIDLYMTKNYTPCTLALLILLFGLVTQTQSLLYKNFYLAAHNEKNPDTPYTPKTRTYAQIHRDQKYIESLDKLFKDVEEAIHKGTSLRKLFSKATDPSGPYKLTFNEWMENLRIIKAKMSESVASRLKKVKRRYAPY